MLVRVHRRLDEQLEISKVDEESNQVPCRVIRDGNCNVKFDPLFSCSLLGLTAADVVRNKSLMQMCLYRTKSLTNKLRC
ncbi:hypothetical protein P8452_04647 [Trifolium repens]|nr:hypothetical protein P8452_04647 [Trifolium repens]